MNADRTRRRAVLPPAGALALLVLLALGVLLVPSRDASGDRLRACLQDSAHFPLFAAMSYLVARLRPKSLPWRRRLGDALGVVLLVALTAELVQPVAGRSTSLRDLLFGASGALAGSLVFGATIAHRPRLRGALLALAAMVTVGAATPAAVVVADRWVADGQMPVLASLESPLEIGRWKGEGCRLSRIREHASDGRWALLVEVRTNAPYPGAFLADFPSDWSRLRSLCLDVFLPGGDGRHIWLRLDDRPGAPYDDRFQDLLALRAGSNRVCVGREKLVTPSGRPLDLSSVHLMGVFFDQARAGDRLYLDHVVAAP